MWRFRHFGRMAVAAVAVLLAAVAVSCDSIDDERLPPAPVRLTFANIGEWNVYGVGGALDHRRFIRELKIPANFNYTELSYTGFGGILLVGDINGEPQAYDLACPVECRSDVRVSVTDGSYAECPKCHSTYEIFTNFGYPLSGEAAKRGYGLTRYKVFFGGATEYAVITR